jgi:hypothetical protein
MADSAYLRLGHALCAANAKFTRNGLRQMIGHEANYRRWLQRYVWERTGLDWRSVQREIRQEFFETFYQVYLAETGKDFPSKPTIPDRNSCTCSRIARPEVFRLKSTLSQYDHNRNHRCHGSNRNRAAKVKRNRS